MSEDRFFQRLRDEARVLRYEPDDPATWTRLGARIRARVEAPPLTVSQLLASWSRPIAAALAGLAIIISVAVGLAQQQLHESASTIDSITSSADVNLINEELSGVE